MEKREKKQPHEKAAFSYVFTVFPDNVRLIFLVYDTDGTTESVLENIKELIVLEILSIVICNAAH